MQQGELILVIVLAIMAIGSFVIGYLQFKERGVLLNNVYIYASKEERRLMNKKPYYRQSATVFCGSGIMSLTISSMIVLQEDWLLYIVYIESILLIIYAIVSAVIIQKRYE